MHEISRSVIPLTDPFIGKTIASFGVPDDFTTTTWWSDGPRPGQPGMAVILGHHHNEGNGIFNRLLTLRTGDLIELSAGRTVFDYHVDAFDRYLPKTSPSALADALSAHAGSEDLALVSCTGATDPASHQILANAIVYASLTAEKNM